MSSGTRNQCHEIGRLDRDAHLRRVELRPPWPCPLVPWPSPTLCCRASSVRFTPAPLYPSGVPLARRNLGPETVFHCFMTESLQTPPLHAVLVMEHGKGQESAC